MHSLNSKQFEAEYINSDLASTVKGVASNDDDVGRCHRGFNVMTFDNKHHQEISRNNCKLLEKRREAD